MAEKTLHGNKTVQEKIAFSLMCLYIAVLNFPWVMSVRQASFFAALALAVYATARRWEWPPLRAQLIFWAGAALISLLWSGNAAFSFSEIKKEILYSIAAFWLFFVLTRTRGDFRVISGVIILSAVLAAAASLYMYFGLHKDIENLKQTSLLYEMRAYYSFFMISAAVFCLSFAVSRDVKPFIRALSLLLLPICLLCVYFARLRAGYLSILAAALVFALYYGFIGRTLRTKLTVLFVAALISLPLPLILTKKDLRVTASLSPASTVNSLEQEDRLLVWRAALNIIKERPILGRGFGFKEFDHDIKLPWLSGKRIDAHNLFLNYTLMTGVIGPIALLFLFGKLFMMLNANALKYRTAGEWPFSVNISGVMILAVFLTINMTSDIMTRHTGQFFWSIMGVVLGASRGLGGGSETTIREKI